VTAEDRERIRATPESYDRPSSRSDEVIRTSEATAADLAAISAPIQKEAGPTEDFPPRRADKPPAGPVREGTADGGTAQEMRRAETRTNATRADSGEAGDEARDEQGQAGRGARKGGRRGIRLKDKLPGKTDLGLG
jgi:hypothetical protein